METRTELILLQRTMVVVEGVARSLNPAMNMWETARPVVTDYIGENIGPKAMVRDLARDAAGAGAVRAAAAADGRGRAHPGKREAGAGTARALAGLGRGARRGGHRCGARRAGEPALSSGPGGRAWRHSTRGGGAEQLTAAAASR